MMETDIDFSNKVVLITGSSTGIGAATAILFATKGAKVVVTGRNEDKIRDVVKKCIEASPNGNKAIGIPGDVTKDADVKNLIKQTIDAFEKLDILISNAGAGSNCNIDDPKFMHHFDNMINLNVRSPLLICQLATPYLAKTKGNIVIISSTASMVPFPGFVGYSCGKKALDSVSQNLALELGPKGIRVNCIRPGAVRTEFISRQGLPIPTALMYDQFKGMSPLNIYGKTPDITRVIAFLASDNAEHMTGSLLVIDGGITLMSPAAHSALKLMKCSCKLL